MGVKEGDRERVREYWGREKVKMSMCEMDMSGSWYGI